MKGENFAEHVFVKCPQNKNQIFDGQNGIWHALKTLILNTTYKSYL